MTSLLIGLVSFLAGVGVGVALPVEKITARSPFGLSRRVHTDHVTPDPVDATTPRRRTLLALVLAALAVNALLGFLQIATAVRVEDQARGDAAAVECQEDYNVRLGLALDERNARVREVARSERDLWADYLEQVEVVRTDKGNLSAAQAAFERSVREHMRAIGTAEASRARHPYPPPDLCRRLGE